MDFGIFTDFPVRMGMVDTEAFDEGFSQVELADRAGIDSVWLAEYHFSPDRSVSAAPLIVGSAVAARTRNIRIGLAVQVLPLFNPLRVAEEVATMDHVSKGRFNFGIGRSGSTKFYDAFGIDYSESRSRFYESLDVITGAWTNDSLSHHGEHFDFDDVSVVPKPYQKPYPPFRVAIASEDSYSQMGELGYPIFIMSNTPLPQLEERVSQYRDAWRSAGHPGSGDVMLRAPAFVSESADEAYSAPEVSTMHGIAYRVRELMASAASQEVIDRLKKVADVPYDEILKARCIYGTPEAVVERIHEFDDRLGLNGILMEVNYGGQIPYDKVVDTIQLLADRVMPRFR